MGKTSGSKAAGPREAPKQLQHKALPVQLSHWLPAWELPNDKGFARTGLCGLPEEKLELGVLSTLLRPLFTGIVPQLSSKLGVWCETRALSKQGPEVWVLSIQVLAKDVDP